MRFAGIVFIGALLLVLEAVGAERIRPIERFAPDYPQQALKDELAGKVVASLTVDDNGDVEAVEIVSESPTGHGFAQAAETAFRKWKYPKGHPGRYSGTFVFAPGELPLTPEEAALDFADKPISRTPPKYPNYALDRGAEGEVLLIITIAANGIVETARIAGENPPGFEFGAAAVKAAENWRFAPGGRAIYALTVRFGIAGMQTPDDVALPADGLPNAPAPERTKKPAYPSKAKKAGVEGVVEFGIQIDDDGRITHAGVLAEGPAGYDFAANAYKSLEFWRFPDDMPGTYRLRIEFKLGNQR